MVRHKNAHEMDIRRDTPETDSELSAQSLCHFPLQPRLSHNRKFIFRPHTAVRILNYRTSNFDRAISVFSVTRGNRAVWGLNRTVQVTRRCLLNFMKICGLLMQK